MDEIKVEVVTEDLKSKNNPLGDYMIKGGPGRQPGTKYKVSILWDKCVSMALKSGLPEFISDVYTHGTRREKLELTKAFISKMPQETKLSGDLGVGPTIILIAPNEAKNDVISTQLDTKQDASSIT